MSAELLAVLLLISGGLLLWSVLRARRLSARLHALDAQLQRAEALGQEQAARLAALETLRDSQQFAEHAVATGTAVVKEVHKGIANIPFSVLEAIPATRAPAKALRGLHDSISDGVYGALAGLNKAVGRELRKGFEAESFASDARVGLERPAKDGRAGDSSETQGLAMDGKLDDAPAPLAAEPPANLDSSAAPKVVSQEDEQPPSTTPKSWG